MSAMDRMPWSGWAISTCGSFCMKAATAFTGAFSWARFSTMKLLEPMPRSTAWLARSWGTFTLGPPWTMVTSSPRFLYSPVATAS